MLLELLRIHDDKALARFLDTVRPLELALARLSPPHTELFGSHMAPTVFARAVAGSVEISGFSASQAEVTSVLAGEQIDLNPSAVAAIRGVADALHAVLDRPGELPLSESQLKYLQSLLLRHDASAAPFRRQYRREGDDAAAIAASVGTLVAWTREHLDTTSAAGGNVPPYLVIAAFAWRLLEIHPFAVGNGRLCRTVTAQLLVQYGYGFQIVEPVEHALASRSGRLASALERRDVAEWIAVFLEALASCAGAAAAVLETRPSSGMAAMGRDAASVPGSILLTPRQERVLEAMRERGAAKIGDLLPLLGIPRATLKKDLRTLVDSGKLSSTGIRKGTVYRVLPDSDTG